MRVDARAFTEGQGRKPTAYWFYGQLVTVHVTGEESEGRFSLVEFLMSPDHMTPLHVHHRDSQTVYVLEGEVTIWLPGRAHVLRPGACIYQPAGVPHTERVTSAEPARVLDVNSPAGFDEFVAAAGERAAALTLPPADHPEPDLERLAALAAEHDIELLGPPSSLP
jgi:mannose-6-phosphate isomerase-like protein (cupin superfamily)